MLLIAIGVFFLGRWLIKKRPFEKVDLWRRILHVGIALFIFELISVEIRDGFDQALYALDLSFAKAQRLENMKQLLMSLAWILYSFSLLIIGMWRKVQTMRLLAISLLGLSILKIFIIDLAFLDTLYRIFSFMVLGLILLGIRMCMENIKIGLNETAKGNQEIPGMLLVTKRHSQHPPSIVISKWGDVLKK